MDLKTHLITTLQCEDKEAGVRITIDLPYGGLTENPNNIPAYTRWKIFSLLEKIKHNLTVGNMEE